VKDTTLNVVRAEMNRMYEELRARCPSLDPSKVIIIGHSLGSVIGYDLIKENELAREKLAAAAASGASEAAAPNDETEVAHRLLQFTPKQFFLLGSPLGLFLLLRAGFKENSPSIQFHDDLLHSTQYFSIYHPLDPVAYRIEPLIDSRFADLEPLKVPVFSAPTPLTDIGDKISHWLMGLRDGLNMDMYVSQFREKTTSLRKKKDGATVSETKKEGQQPQPQTEEEAIQEAEDASLAEMLAHQQRPHLASAPSDDLKRFKRVDHELTVAPVINPYLISGHTHLSYWEMRDVAAFILDKLFDTPAVPTMTK
jgi:DDHD domain